MSGVYEQRMGKKEKICFLWGFCSCAAVVAVLVDIKLEVIGFRADLNLSFSCFTGVQTKLIYALYTPRSLSFETGITFV